MIFGFFEGYSAEGGKRSGRHFKLGYFLIIGDTQIPVSLQDFWYTPAMRIELLLIL